MAYSHEWRPDWRRPEAYGFTKDLGLARWAWEFVRRNPDYQRFWEEEAPALAAADRESRAFHGFDAAPAEEGNDALGLFSWRQESRDACQREWGFNLAYDPASNEPFFLQFTGKTTLQLPLAYPLRLDTDPRSGRDHRLELIDKLESWPGLDAAPLRLALLDLRAPLKPQLEAVKAHAQEDKKRFGIKSFRSKKPSDPSTSNWPMYLRVLDAVADLYGPDPTQIRGGRYGAVADGLWPDATTDLEERARDYYRRAVELSSPGPGGYLHFLGLPHR